MPLLLRQPVDGSPFATAGAAYPEAAVEATEVEGRTWDVVVVGAGPAGALAARELARAGAAVLFVDRATFPRPKVCGCCLNLRALGTLEAVGLGDLVTRLGRVRLTRLQLAAGGRAALLALPGGAAVSRTAFDAALVEAAAAAGACFLPGAEARLGACFQAARGVVLRQAGRTRSLAARVVVAADGLGGGFAHREPHARAVVDPHSRFGAGTIVADAPAAYRAGTIAMACGTGGYVGLVRLEDGTLNVAAALDRAAVRRAGGVATAAAAILHEAGLPPIPNLAAPRWRGTPLLTQRVAAPAAERVFALGDAAGYVEPFTGEGMAWALAGAAAAVPLVLRACASWHPALIRAWAERHRRVVVRRQWLCRGLARALRSPALVRAAVALLSRMPLLAVPFTHYLNHQAGRPLSGSGTASVPKGIGCSLGFNR
jgi:flavin-dependent dehydrogenase